MVRHRRPGQRAGSAPRFRQARIFIDTLLAIATHAGESFFSLVGTLVVSAWGYLVRHRKKITVGGVMVFVATMLTIAVNVGQLNAMLWPTPTPAATATLNPTATATPTVNPTAASNPTATATTQPKAVQTAPINTPPVTRVPAAYPGLPNTGGGSEQHAPQYPTISLPNWNVSPELRSTIAQLIAALIVAMVAGLGLGYAYIRIGGCQRSEYLSYAYVDLPY